MLRSYFLLAIRTLLRNMAPFAINLTGMSIALACCIAAWVNYEFNSGFDSEQTKAENVYRISFIQRSESARHYGVTPLPMPSLLEGTLSDIDRVCRYLSADAVIRIGDEMFREQIVYTDASFREFFNIDIVAGRYEPGDPSQILVSTKLASKYFHSTDVVGKTLTQIVSGQPREFVIAGVFREFPSNSSFRFNLLTNYDNYFADAATRAVQENDWSRWVTTFVRITNPAAKSTIEKQLRQYVTRQNEARDDLQISEFYLEPFIGMSKRAVAQRKAGHWFNQPMSPAAVVAPFAMAGFLLLVACFNFTNNSIAVAARRLKEIGIRKVVGGRRKELIIQFLSEAFIFCMIALLISLWLAEYFVAGWAMLWPGIDMSLRYADNLPFIAAIFSLLVVTALLSGSYPAFYISSFKPIHVLKGTTRFGANNLFTRSLLVLQFSISLAAVIFAIAFYFNSKFQKEFDLGYDYSSVVQVPIEDPSQYNALRNALSANPLVSSMGGSRHHIYNSSYKAAALANGFEKEVDVLDVGDGYFETLNVRLTAGRSFVENSASDMRESVIVNEAFLKHFNLKASVGTRILLNDTTPAFIAGVVRDVYLRALFQPLSPVVFRYVPVDDYRYFLASASPGNLLSLNDHVRSQWKKLYPDTLYPGELMEDDMVMVMEHFDNVVILYTFLGAVAIIMSASGLFSLVSIHLQRRIKELGIRKILGASTGHIIFQSGKLFLIVMFFAFAIGSISGTVMVNRLMDSIWEYYVPIGVNVIGLSIVILFLIAALTVSSIIASVTRANPADALRHE